MQGPAQTPLQAFQNAWAERVYARCPPAALARTNRARGCLLRRAALSQPPARARARSTRREPLGRSWVRGVALPDSAATFGRPPAAAVRGPGSSICDVAACQDAGAPCAQGGQAGRAIFPVDRPRESSQDPEHPAHGLYVRSHGAHADAARRGALRPQGACC